MFTTLLNTLIFIIVIGKIIFVTSAAGSHRFGYLGQSLWKKDHPHCGGHMQSPVRISRHKSISLPLPAVEMVGFHNLLPVPLHLMNNGHTVVLSPDKRIIPFLPRIFGATLQSEYHLENIHFHWGGKNNRGSEHILNGIHYPMEMHLVHKNVKYNTTAEAQGYAQGLAVLAYVFQLREKSNPALNPFLSALPSIRFEGDSLYLKHSFTLSSILPTDNDIYYTYNGSLTTPPCSEAVTWFVFPEPIFIGFSQMKLFRQIKTGHDYLIDNYRYIQPLKHREVFIRNIGSNGTL